MVALRRISRRRGKLTPLLLLVVLVVLTMLLLGCGYLDNGSAEDGRDSTLEEVMRQRGESSWDGRKSGLVSKEDKFNYFRRTSNNSNSVTLQKLLRNRNTNYKPHGAKGLTAIRLIGERHSGTNWATEVLFRCFPTINVHNTLVNQKHWMQHSPEHIVKMANTYGSKNGGLSNARVRFGAQFNYYEIAQSPNPHQVFNQTFVVVIFRDPYDWMDAMRLTPHHWPNHQDYDQSPAFRNAIRTRVASRRQRNEGGQQQVRQDRRNARISFAEKLMDRGSSRMEQGTGQKLRQQHSRLDMLRQQRKFRERYLQHRRRLIDQSEKLIGTDEKYKDNSRNVLLEEREEAVTTNQVHDSGSIPLPWRGFVESNMTIGRAYPVGEPQLCQKGFDYGRISPCVVSRSYAPKGIHPKLAAEIKGSPSDPVYELKIDGTPYSNPLEFRTAKMKNFLELPDKWELGGFLAIKYEDLKQHGTQFLLDVISKEFEILPQCEPTPPNAERGDHELDTEFQQWITENSDWETEANMGYKPRMGGMM